MSEAKITLTAENKTKAAFASLAQDLGKAQAQAAALGGAFTAVSGVLGGAFAGLSLAAFVKQTALGIDSLNDLKDATGASIENISALEDIAARTGTSFESMSSTLVKFNKVLSDAGPGSGGENIFKALGLSVQELKAQDPAEALRRVAVALSGFADGGDKARIVQEWFGKSVREAAPLLNDLAAAGELNAKVTTKQAEQAERFNQQLSAMAKNSTDLARALVSDLLPTLSQALLLLTKFKEGPGLLAVVGEAFKGNSFGIESAQQGLNAYGEKISAIDAKIKQLKSDPRPLMAIGRESEIAGLEQQRKALEQFAAVYRDVLNTNNAGGGRGAVNPGEKPKPVLEVAESATSSGKIERFKGLDYAAELSQAIGKLAEDTNVVKIAKINAELEKLNQLAALGFDPVIVADIRAGLFAKLPQQIEPASEAFRRLELAGAAAANAAFDTAQIEAYTADQKRLADLLENTVSVQLEKVRADMDYLAQAMQAGRISAEQFSEAATARLGLVSKETEKTKSLAEELGLTFTSAFEDAIVSGGGLGSAIRGLEKDLIRLIARRTLLEPLAKQVEGIFSSGGGSGSAGGGDGFGSIFTTLISSFFGPGRANGGAVYPGMLHPINETGQGPGEILTAGSRQYLLPTQPGAVKPNNDAGSSGPLVGAMHFAITGPVDRRTQQQIAAAAGAGVQRALRRNA